MIGAGDDDDNDGERCRRRELMFREFKQRRRQQRERHWSPVPLSLISKILYRSARTLYTLVHFFAVLTAAKQQREMNKFNVYGERKHMKVPFLYLNAFLKHLDSSSTLYKWTTLG